MNAPASAPDLPGIRAHNDLHANPRVELHHHIERITLNATVRRSPVTHEADGPIPDEERVAAHPRDLPPLLREGLEDGETADLPGYASSYPPDGETDSISANFTYSPSVAVSPDEPKDPTDFGTTWGNHIRTSGGKIHKEPGRFEVTLTYENPIVIKVYKDTGPRNQINIESETDPILTPATTRLSRPT